MSSPAKDAAPDPRRWKALGVLALIQFMLILDITVVNVALPKIHDSLKFETYSGLAWVVNAYVLTAGGFLLLGGRLADVFGRRRLFLGGVALFAVASAVCGAAVDPGMLVGARFVQGFGEAFAGPASLGLIALMFPDPGERVKALGVWGGVAGLGGTTGTVISGFITEWLSWRWIFLINLPVAVFALLVVPRLVTESRMHRDSAKPDFWGALFGTAGLIGIVDGVINASNHSLHGWQVLVPLCAGLALLGLMLIIEARSAAPLIPLDFFRNRTRLVTNLCTLLFAPGFFSYFYLLTLYLQKIHDFSPIRGGLAYLPFGLTIGAGIGVGTALMPKLGVKPLFAAGFVLSSVGLFLTSTIDVDTSYAGHVLPGMMVLALGAGISFPVITNAALHKVTQQDSSLASGVQTAFQQVGGAIGLSLLVTLGFRHTSSEVASGTPFLSATTDGYTFAFRIGAVMLLVGAVLVVIFLERVDTKPHLPGADLVAGDEPASPALST